MDQAGGWVRRGIHTYQAGWNVIGAPDEHRPLVSSLYSFDFISHLVLAPYEKKMLGKEDARVHQRSFSVLTAVLCTACVWLVTSELQPITSRYSNSSTLYSLCLTGYFVPQSAPSHRQTGTETKAIHVYSTFLSSHRPRPPSWTFGSMPWYPPTLPAAPLFASCSSPGFPRLRWTRRSPCTPSGEGFRVSGLGIRV